MMPNDLEGAWVFPLQPNSKDPFEGPSWKSYAVPANSPEGQAIFAGVTEGKCNYAIWTGKSNLTVVDIDPDAKPDMETVRASFPTTLTVKTPRGGYHLIYKNENSDALRPRTGVEPGVDVRTGASYIVGYGSTLPEGKYRRHTLDVPRPITSEVVDRISKKGANQENELPDLFAGEVVRTGQIDNTLTSLAGKARWAGMGEQDLLEYLTYINQSGRVIPPASRSDLERIARSVSNYAPGDIRALKTRAKIKEHEEPLFQPYSAVTPLTTRWLWLNRVPSVGITALCGEPEVGKTYMMCKLAADLSTGQQLPFSNTLDPLSVVLYTGEDTATEIQDRLKLCGADLDKVWRFSSTAGVIDRKMWEALDTFLVEHPEVKLVCIDPSAAFLSGADIRNEQEVRDAFEEMRQIAENRQIAFIFMRHLAKREGSIVSRILDSVAFRAIPRSILAATGDDPNKALQHVKNNMGERQPGIGFKIDDQGFHWSSDPVVPLPSFNRMLTKTSQAQAYLREALAEGPLSTKSLFEGADALGLTRADLNNAAIGLSIQKANKMWSFAPSEVGFNPPDSEYISIPLRSRETNIHAVEEACDDD
jgi:hypothetical protein